MDKKLEARIARLEKLLSCKNESTYDFNQVEQKAIASLTALVDALKKAQEDCCKAAAADEWWSGLPWDKIFNNLKTAESYLPRMPKIGLY